MPRLAGACPPMGMRRDFPPSGSGVEAPRLVVFKVINLKPCKRGSPCIRLHEQRAVCHRGVWVDLAKRVIEAHAVDASAAARAVLISTQS